jgi:hydrogenase maturation factor
MRRCDIALTAEQKIRSATDRVADWVFVACGYAMAALKELSETDLASALPRIGIAQENIGFYSISHSATPGDVVDQRGAA